MEIGRRRESLLPQMLLALVVPPVLLVLLIVMILDLLCITGGLLTAVLLGVGLTLLHHFLRESVCAHHVCFETATRVEVAPRWFRASYRLLLTAVSVGLAWVGIAVCHPYYAHGAVSLTPLTVTVAAVCEALSLAYLWKLVQALRKR